MKSHSLKDKSVLMEVRRSLIIAGGLAVLFGLGWGLGLAATSTQEREVTFTFQIIFSIFVGSQGILIFFFHCVRSKESLNQWKEWSSKINKMYVSRTASSHLPSSTSNQSHELSTMSQQLSDDSTAETKQQAHVAPATQRRPSWFERITKKGVYDVLQTTNTPPPQRKEAVTLVAIREHQEECNDEKVAQEEKDTFPTAEHKTQKSFDLLGKYLFAPLDSQQPSQAEHYREKDDSIKVKRSQSDPNVLGYGQPRRADRESTLLPTQEPEEVSQL